MPPLKPRIRSIDDLLGVTETSSSKNESIVDEALALYFAQKEQESEQEAG